MCMLIRGRGSGGAGGRIPTAAITGAVDIITAAGIITGIESCRATRTTIRHPILPLCPLRLVLCACRHATAPGRHTLSAFQFSPFQLFLCTLSLLPYAACQSVSQWEMSESPKSGGELFIVDNSDEAWKGLKYLQDWTEIASAFDIATGYFEIGALLALDGHWQKLDKIRILMGDEVSART